MKDQSSKYRIFKYMAVFISFCYVLSPLYHQFDTMLHNFAHNFGPPEYILQHNFEDIDFSEVIVSQNEKNDLNHRHGVLEILDIVFEGDNSKDPINKSNDLELKVDKHFCNARYSIPQKFSSKSPYIFTKNTLKVQRGYPDTPLKPPAIQPNLESKV